MKSDASSSRAECLECGIDRSELHSVPGSSRPPCPVCGSTSLKFIEHVQETLHITTSVESSLTPGNQDRDWRFRWSELKRRLPQVVGPLSGERDRDQILARAREVLAFYVSAYHLKDALIADGVVERQVVEDAISESEILSLLADLANLEKHRKLRQQTRSGGVPSVGPASDRSGDDGWSIRLPILHNGQQLDGLQFAVDAVAEWEVHLKYWGLVD